MGRDMEKLTRKSLSIYQEAQQRRDLSAKQLKAVYTILSAADSRARTFIRTGDQLNAMVEIIGHPVWKLIDIRISQHRTKYAEAKR